MIFAIVIALVIGDEPKKISYNLVLAGGGILWMIGLAAILYAK